MISRVVTRFCDAIIMQHPTVIIFDMSSVVKPQQPPPLCNLTDHAEEKLTTRVRSSQQEVFSKTIISCFVSCVMCLKLYFTKFQLNTCFASCTLVSRTIEHILVSLTEPVLFLHGDDLFVCDCEHFVAQLFR